MRLRPLLLALLALVVGACATPSDPAGQPAATTSSPTAVSRAAAAQKGFETLSARAVAFQKAALENHVAATKSLFTSKSVQEFTEKQNDYAKSSFEAYVAELTTVSDLVQGVAKETLQPINERVSAVGQLIQANR